jgi:hypothetical protein
MGLFYGTVGGIFIKFVFFNVVDFAKNKPKK